MRRSLALLAITAVLASAASGDWQSVERLKPGQSIQLTTASGDVHRAEFQSATGERLVLRDNSGERSVARTEVKQVQVPDPGRRLRWGLIGMGIGIGAGAGLGVALCPGCAGEGVAYKYVGPGIAVGAGIGALGFLAAPFRTVYRNGR